MTPATSCLSTALVVFGSFATATLFCVSDSTMKFAGPPLTVEDLADRRRLRRRRARRPCPAGGPPRPPPGCGPLPSAMRTKFAVAERRVLVVERRHDLARVLARAHRDRRVEAVGQVHAVARERLVEVRHAVGHHRRRQRRVLLVLGVRHQLAVEVVGRVPRVVVAVVDVLAVRAPAAPWSSRSSASARSASRTTTSRCRRGSWRARAARRAPA